MLGLTKLHRIATGVDLKGFPALSRRVASASAPACDIDLSHVESLFEADADPLIKEPVRIEHKAYVMTPR